MPTRMKQIIIFAIIIGFLATVALNFAGCKASEKVQAKSGAQLWGENCVRCHNGPSPSAYNDQDWETIGAHMRVRANLGADEVEKIVEFLKSAN